MGCLQAGRVSKISSTGLGDHRESRYEDAMSAETLQFKTELKQILDIIIHSLYSHKDIFLRELISNASDAIDTLRFQSLTNAALGEGDTDWKIRIIADEKNGTLTVSDNGIGMSKDTIIENLGTIAKSGTRALLESLKATDVQNRPELIGQFGVGFYSSFMVADRVTVVSRIAGTPKNEGVRWESQGEGEFTVETVEKEAHGTDVTLHLREDDREFLKEWKIRALVRQHSDFVEHPIFLEIAGETEKKNEALNSRKAIWLRPKSDITTDEYNEFYKHVSHDFQDPAKVIHFSAEGAVEFKALLYIPKHRPLDLMWGDSHKGLQLYIRRVFILDDCEVMLPLYLRFVKGVVDSPDLPLNVSREMIQQSPLLEKIKSNLVNKTLRTLDEMKTNEFDRYVEFYRELGAFLKEGTAQDRSNREQLADLLLLESTKTDAGKFTTLARYLEAMPAEQKDIYYLIGESREQIENSPYLETFKEKGQEVLLLTEPIDEFLVQSMTEYKGKTLKAVDKGVVEGTPIDEETKKRFQPLLDFIKEKVPEIKEARLSSRLKDSAVCLVVDEWAMGAHMERLMARLGKDKEIPGTKRILELNPSNAAVRAVQELFAKNASDQRLEKYCRLLYDQAVILEGSRLKNPAEMARSINELVQKDAAG
jgi:molecular chaperone HtpG